MIMDVVRERRFVRLTKLLWRLVERVVVEESEVVTGNERSAEARRERFVMARKPEVKKSE